MELQSQYKGLELWKLPEKGLISLVWTVKGKGVGQLEGMAQGDFFWTNSSKST